MKIKPLKVRLNIEQHFFDTGIIEMSNGDNEWKTLTVPENSIDKYIFRWESFDYRIKKNIQYRPWTNDEFITFSDSWFKLKIDDRMDISNNLYRPIALDIQNDDSKSIIFFKSTGWISFKNLLEDYDRYELVTGKRYICGMKVKNDI